MKLTVSDKKRIEAFFGNKALAQNFIEIFNHLHDYDNKIRFEERDSIIGFGREGEHLRAYIAKSRHGFLIKFKTLKDSIDFCEDNVEDLKKQTLLNHFFFNSEIEKYRLSPQPAKVEKTKIKQSRKSKEKQNPVLAKLKNRNKARKFTVKEFNDLADWEYCRSFNDDGYIYTLPNGNQIECDSKSELALLDYLLSKKLAIEIGGQELCIPYDTAFRESVNYYPDLVILTKDYHIAIIEVKPIKAMSYHINIEKYNALKLYCEENGYEYMMVDPARDYMTFEELKNKHVPQDIVDRIDSYLVNFYGTRKCLIEPDDIPILYEEFKDEYKKGEFELYLHALVIQRGWYNKYTNGFMVYEKPKRT